MFELRGSVYIQGTVNRMWVDCIGKTSLKHLSLAQNQNPSNVYEPLLGFFEPAA